jgi:hypothetical protein
MEFGNSVGNLSIGLKYFNNFAFMRAGILYILFASVAFLFLYSEQKDNICLHNEILPSKYISINNDIICLVPELNFSLQKVFPVSDCLKHPYKSLFENSDYSKIDLYACNLRLYLTQTVVFKPLKQKSFFFPVYYSSEKDTDHLLTV